MNNDSNRTELTVIENDSRSRKNSEMQGLVTNIQHFTIHDGPGIRTEIFMKGCPLSCKWCSNPEGLKAKQQIGIYASRCIGMENCGYCLQACEVEGGRAFRIKENNVVGVNYDVCNGCLKCADACPGNALIVWGKKRSVSDIMKHVLSDKDFYDKSGGGVTLSGGEALLQWEFTLALLQECKKHDIHTCIESTLHCKPPILDSVYPYTDLVITDLKHMDDAVHKKYTGVGNSLIHQNIKKTIRMGIPVILRIPVIPGINDTRDNLIQTAAFITEELRNSILQLQLLPYRELGVEKYQTLGMAYPMADFDSAGRDVWEKNILDHVETMRSFGIPAFAGAANAIPIPG